MDILRAPFYRNHTELEETMLECDSCDYTCTKKDTLRMHKGVKHKAKLSNWDECDYFCTTNNVPVMHNFRKHGGQEPPRKLCEVCDLTCQTTGGLRFHKNAEPSRMEGPQGFKCDLCDYTDSKITPSESMLLFLKYYFKNIALVWSVQMFMY